MMHLWRQKEILYIGPPCDQRDTYANTRAQTHNALHPLLLTPTPLRPSPPGHSLFPKTASPFLPFLPMHIVQKLYFWLTRLEHKGSSYTSRRSPTREASIPSRLGERAQKELALLFPSLTFPYKIKPLGFWMVCAIFFTHATPPSPLPILSAFS